MNCLTINSTGSDVLSNFTFFKCILRCINISVKTNFQVLKCVKCYKAMGNRNVVLKCEYQTVKENRRTNMVKSCLEEHFSSMHMTINEDNIFSYRLSLLKKTKKATHTVLICFFLQSLTYPVVKGT